MDQKNTGGRGNGLGWVFASVWRRSLPLLASVMLVLAPAASAQDGRTILSPGWNMFSPQQDVEVGQEVSVNAERELPMLGDSRVDDYVTNLGRRLADEAPGEKYPYTFKVVNDRSINAFALPGGPIYINRGVIEAADNESHLAGVIAHEISHVALRHGTNQASKASAAQLPLAILGGLLGSNSTTAILSQLGASFAVNSILLKYSRSAESQADTMGTQILFDAGYDPRAMGQFFEKIEAQQEGSGPVEFFSNHPNPDNRIGRVNEEVNALGGVRRGVTTNSGEFDDIKRRLQSSPAHGGQESQTAAPGGATGLQIVSARYGAGDRSVDVRSRLQSLVENGRLVVEVNNSSMGGDPIVGEVKTLHMTYQLGNRTYNLTVREDQRFSIPTDQQVSDFNRESESTPVWPSERFVGAENALLRISHPDNWQANGQGDSMAITPSGGLITDGQGNQALAYGVIVNIFEPRPDGFGQQLQGPGFETGQNSATRLEQSTGELIQEFRLSNRNMRVIRYGEVIRVDGIQALSTYLSNDSPIGGRETNWLVTIERPEGLLFIVSTAPEREFQRYDGVFHEMLRSVRISR